MRKYQIQYKIGIRIATHGGSDDREAYLEQMRRHTSYDMRCDKLSHFCQVNDVELLRAYVAFEPVTSYATRGTVRLLDCDLQVTILADTNNPSNLSAVLPSSCVFVVSPEEYTGIKINQILFTGLEHLAEIDVTMEDHMPYRAPYTAKDLAVEIIMPTDIKVQVRDALAAGKKVYLVHSRFEDAGEDWSAIEIEGQEVWRVNGY